MNTTKWIEIKLRKCILLKNYTDIPTDTDLCVKEETSSVWSSDAWRVSLKLSGDATCSFLGQSWSMRLKWVVAKLEQSPGYTCLMSPLTLPKKK